MELIPFLGRFHVILLHLPIGILTLAAVVEIYSAWKRPAARPSMLNAAWLLGWMSGAVTCGLGYLLSLSGGYDETAIDRHFLWGIVATAVGLVGWIAYGRLSGRAWRVGGGIVQIVTLSLAGHLGGSLTHGPEYLFEYAPNPVRVMAGFEARLEPRPEIVFLDDAHIFLDVVQPILNNRCTSCHHPGKTKGELLLDTYAGIMQGGESGAAVVPGDLLASELVVRINLDPEHKEFMPSDGKPPLTVDEQAVLEWWIQIGAPAQGTLFDFNPAAQFRPRLAAALGIQSRENELGLKRREMIASEIVVELENLGFDVKPISQEIAYLDIDYYGLGSERITDAKLQALARAKDHIAWLNLGGSGLTDEQLGLVAGLPNLLKLKLDRNPLTDVGLARLESLKRLEMINLHGTQVSEAAWATLDTLPRLKKAFVWGTAIDPASAADRAYPVFGLDLASDPEPSPES